jgi:hypothetical protein
LMKSHTVRRPFLPFLETFAGGRRSGFVKG